MSDREMYTELMAESHEKDPATDRVAETRNPYGEQDAWGNSIGSLRANLRLTPLERLRKADRFAEFVKKYQGVANRRKV